jgi:uncharacterized membrane protein YhaH (DUF805 family)
MGWLKFFGNLDGRIGRKKFWLMSISVFAIEFIVGIFGIVVATALSLGDWWIDVILIAFLYPQFVISVKRGHDRNISWWVIAAYTVFAAARDELIQFGWLVGLPNQNTMSSRDAISFAVTIPLAIVGLALLVELGFRQGTQGQNRYGPDPFAKARA